MNKVNFWDRVKDVFKTNLSLTIIIVAALLLELTTGLLYYSAQNIIQQTMERLVEREMNALFLCIRNQLAQVEVTVDNMAWVVAGDIAQPDSMFVTAREMVQHNPSVLGGGVTFIPNYYPQKGRLFEPYAARRANGRIETMQLSSDENDYTKKDFFTIPLAKGRGSWCEPYLDSIGAQATVTTYGVPVRDQKDSIVGIVSVDISLDWLDEIVEEDKMYQSTQRYIVTGAGHLLAGKDNETFQLARKLLNADDDKVGHETIEDKYGEKLHVFFHPVGGKTDWILISVMSDSDVFSKLSRIRTGLLLPVLSGLILIGFIVYRTSRNLERLRKVNAEKERIGGELRVASLIQQSMLPQQHLCQDEVEIYGSLVPAREVGGDLYDYYIRDEKLFFCIGDVSGKGAASAMVMGVIHSLFRAFSTHENNPAHIMKSINEASCRGNDSNIFVTLFVGVLDLPTGRLRYCDAGHDCPILLSSELRGVDCHPHLPVGIFDDVKYGMQETVVMPGSTLFLYTDGLTEARSKEHQFFGLQRVYDVLGKSIEMSPQKLLETISESVGDFVKGAEQSDDLTMLAIHYTPKKFESTLTETLVLKNDVHEVPQLSNFMKSVSEKLAIEQSQARQLRLAVEEAVVNVIDYAYPPGMEGDITVKMMSDGHTLHVQIIDAGVPFDPTEKKMTDTSLSAEERQIGGLGILLVRELMDSINYEREDGKNVLTLIKNITI